MTMQETLSQTIRKGNSTPAQDRLVDSAPTMLELLEESIMYVEECEQFHKPGCRTLSKRIRAAIKSAEGGK
jgi:hypothetical protein